MKTRILFALLACALALATTARAEQSGAGHYISGMFSDFSTTLPSAEGFSFLNFGLWLRQRPGGRHARPALWRGSRRKHQGHGICRDARRPLRASFPDSGRPTLCRRRPALCCAAGQSPGRHHDAPGRSLPRPDRLGEWPQRHHLAAVRNWLDQWRLQVRHRPLDLRAHRRIQPGPARQRGAGLLDLYADALRSVG